MKYGLVTCVNESDAFMDIGLTFDGGSVNYNYLKYPKVAKKLYADNKIQILNFIFDKDKLLPEESTKKNELVSLSGYTIGEYDIMRQGTFFKLFYFKLLEEKIYCPWIDYFRLYGFIRLILKHYKTDSLFINAGMLMTNIEGNDIYYTKDYIVRSENIFSKSSRNIQNSTYGFILNFDNYFDNTDNYLIESVDMDECICGIFRVNNGRIEFTLEEFKSNSKILYGRRVHGIIKNNFDNDLLEHLDFSITEYSNHTKIDLDFIDNLQEKNKGCRSTHVLRIDSQVKMTELLEITSMFFQVEYLKVRLEQTMREQFGLS